MGLRHKRVWLIVAVAALNVLSVVPAPPVGAVLKLKGDAVGSGGGNLRGVFTERAVNRDRLCFSSVNHIESYPDVGSDSAYVATYEVGGLTYSGPVTLRLQPFLAFQNAQGTFSDDTCQLDTLGARSEVPGGTLEGEVSGRLLDCTYTEGTWRRVESLITMALEGTCTITVGATSATAETAELHEAIGYFSEPHLDEGGPDPNDPNSFPLPPDAGMWLDAFVAPGADPLPPKLLPKLCRPNCPPVP